MATSGRALQFERMLFFSDAVFAIAITLLVIEIRLPHLGDGSNQALVNALLSLIPNYVGFLVSFFVVGRFWIGHHTEFGFISDFDRSLVWRNLLFLGAIAFMPFPTAVIAERGGTPGAVIFYGLWLTVAGLLNLSLFSRVRKIAETEHGTLTAEQRAMMRGGLMPIIIGATASVGAAFDVRIGLLALILSPLFMLVFQRLTGPKKPGIAA